MRRLQKKDTLTHAIDVLIRDEKKEGKQKNEAVEWDPIPATLVHMVPSYNLQGSEWEPILNLECERNKWYNKEGGDVEEEKKILMKNETGIKYQVNNSAIYFELFI